MRAGSWYRAKAWILGGFVTAMPLLSTWLLWFPPDGQRVYLRSDFLEHLGPRGYFYQALSQGKLILWDRLHDTGLPILSYIFDAFNPVILLYVFTLDQGLLRSHPMQAMMVGHLAIGALGAYLWGLALKRGLTASAVMGLCWGLSGFVLVKASGHDLVIHTLTWWPYVFLFLDLARRKGSILHSAWAGFFLAMTFLGGHPQFFYYLAVALAAHGAWWASVRIREKGFKKAWPGLWRLYLPMGLAAMVLAAPQLGHMLDIALNGLKPVYPCGDAGDLIFSQEASGHIHQLTRFLLPLFDSGFVETFSGIGVIGLLAALAGFYHRRGPEGGYWRLILVVSVFLMLGGNAGLHKVLVDVLPGMALFRETRRWIVLAHLALTALAGAGLWWLLETGRAPRTAPLARLTAWLCGILGVGLFLVLLAQAAEIRLEHRQRILEALTSAFLLCALFWLILKRAGQGRGGPALKLLIVALVAFELGFWQLPLSIHERTEIQADPSRVSAAEDRQVRDWLDQAKGGPWRFWIKPRFFSQAAAYRHGLMRISEMPPHVERLFPRAFWQIFWHPADNPRFMDLLGARFVDRRLPAAAASRDHWRVVGYSQAAARLGSPARVSQVQAACTADFIGGLTPGAELGTIFLAHRGRITAQWPIKLGEQTRGIPLVFNLDQPVMADEVIITSSRAKALLEVGGLSLDGRPVVDRPRLAAAGGGLMENPNALPLLHFVGRAAVIPPRGEYLAALGSVDPGRCVLFREPPPGFSAPAGPSPANHGSARIDAFGDERVAATVTADAPGYVVMSQSAFAGWRARVDGKPVSVLRAYGFLCAVPVPAGEHKVVFSYREPLVYAGLVLAGLGFCGLALWSLFGFIGRRRGPRADPPG